MKRNGFSLVEAMVTVGIVGLLAALALPATADWIANSRLRGVSEDLASGLRQARADAVRLNTTLRFDTVQTGWRIRDLDGEVLGERPATARESAISVGASDSEVRFDGRGRADRLYVVDVKRGGCRAAGGESLCLRLRVSPGGSVLMCDPAVSGADARVCP